MLGGADHLAVYRALVEVAQTELALATAGHWSELAGVHDSWALALASLPPRPPADAEPLLRRALALSEQTEQVVSLARDGVMRQLGGVNEQRKVGRAYQPAPSAAPVMQLNLSA